MNHVLARSARLPGVVSILGVFALVLGCATASPPLDLMDSAGGAVKRAEESGAGEYAPLELKFARQKYAEAQSAMNREDYDEARRLANECMANAELAEAKTNAARARAAARQVGESVEALRNELLREEGDHDST